MKCDCLRCTNGLKGCINHASSRLRGDMNTLVLEIARLCKAWTVGDVHARICSSIAEDFNLWDSNDRFPTWLSRVVEGVMADIRNNEFEPPTE